MSLVFQVLIMSAFPIGNRLPMRLEKDTNHAIGRARSLSVRPIGDSDCGVVTECNDLFSTDRIYRSGRTKGKEA